jgi:hypothetical protein
VPLQIHVVDKLAKLNIALKTHSFENGTDSASDNSTACGSFVAIDANNTYEVTLGVGVASHYTLFYNHVAYNLTSSGAQNTTVTLPPFEVRNISFALFSYGNVC